MELRHLRYFVAVAEELHFSRAAAKLNIATPTLSAQIQALEALLGAQLFTRKTRSVALTHVGTRFLDEARATLKQAEQAAVVRRRAATWAPSPSAMCFRRPAGDMWLPRSWISANPIRMFRFSFARWK